MRERTAGNAIKAVSNAYLVFTACAGGTHGPGDPIYSQCRDSAEDADGGIDVSGEESFAVTYSAHAGAKKVVFSVHGHLDGSPLTQGECHPEVKYLCDGTWSVTNGGDETSTISSGSTDASDDESGEGLGACVNSFNASVPEGDAYAADPASAVWLKLVRQHGDLLHPKIYRLGEQCVVEVAIEYAGQGAGSVGGFNGSVDGDWSSSSRPIFDLSEADERGNATLNGDGLLDLE